MKAIKFPPPIYPHSLNDHVKYNTDVAEENAQKSMNSDAASLCSDDNVGEISVSADGTWQKRYGHNALLGASFVLFVNNGQVLDYAIKSKTCLVCKRPPNSQHKIP